jgi:predicted RNA methylase
VPIKPEQQIPIRVSEYNRSVDEIKANIRNIARDQSIKDENERQKKIDEQVKKLENEGELFNAKLNPVQ